MSKWQFWKSEPKLSIDDIIPIQHRPQCEGHITVERGAIVSCFLAQHAYDSSMHQGRTPEGRLLIWQVYG